jgi:hypothetical protein
MDATSDHAPNQPRSFDFCFIHLDYTLVRVEELEGRVTVRATADTFSKRRKEAFLRELAAEGFIADEWPCSLFDGQAELQRVRWLIDRSWVKPDKALAERNHRLVKRFFLPAALGWLAFMYGALAGHGGIRAENPGPNALHPGAYGSR